MFSLFFWNFQKGSTSKTYVSSIFFSYYFYFVGNKLYRMHSRSMHGVFLCAHCEFSSEIAEVLEDHRKISHPGLCGRKLCKKCRVLYQGEELEEHERICSGEKQNWTCPICQKEFKFLSVMKAHARKWHPNESIIIPSKTITASLAGHLDSTQQTSAADSTTGEMTPDNEINITNNKNDDFCRHSYIPNKNPMPNTDSLSKGPNLFMHRSKPIEKMGYPEEKRPVYNKNIEPMSEIPPLELAFYCDFEGCYTTFRSDKELNVHRSSIHGLPPKRYHCRQPECSMQFAKFGHYKRHQLSHGGSCSKRFCYAFFDVQGKHCFLFVFNILKNFLIFKKSPLFY